ncbi:MAG: DMT family transporter [Clostridia bacterium]|nr:DMT family transporter [Clostridia bacterium]
MKKNNLKGIPILCTAALIWGLSFVAQSVAADILSAFTINSLRSFVGALVLLVINTVKSRGKSFFPTSKTERKKYLRAALICGFFFSVAANLQQFGIMLYPDGVPNEARAGFLTALYVVFVPIFGLLFGKKTGGLVLVGVAISAVGVYLLCLKNGFHGIYLGDLLLLLCSFGYTMHILTVDRYVEFTGGIKLCILQLTVCGVISGILAIFLEHPALSQIIAGAPYILYLGVFSSGIAYTLQVIGQQYAEPAVASLSMCLESVFAALGGWILLGNTLTGREILGCALMLIAILIAQIPELHAKT